MNNIKTTLRTTLLRAGYLALALCMPLGGALYAQQSSSSSSNYAYNNNPFENNPFGNGQYGNGQYGNGPYNNPPHKLRYNGHNWSDHWALEGGGGVTVPGGNTQNYANTGFNILLGGGYKFNDRLSLLAEWNFNYLFVPNSLAAAVAQTPQGNEHIWTVDLNPKYNFVRRGPMDGYVIGGGGFSRALTNFTVPVYVPCYGYGYGFGYGYGCSGSITVAHTSTNQGNVDVGVGAEWRVDPYGSAKIFLEARYEKLFSPNTGLPPGNNANLIPVTAGLRW